MKYWLNHLFWTVCRLLLSLRYRVRVEGLEQLDALSGATLVLPNHPAYIDPLLVASRVRLSQPLRDGLLGHVPQILAEAVDAAG